jgi:hypothetical protein
MIDLSLAFASGTTQDLLENALPSEQKLWLSLDKEAELLVKCFRKDTEKYLAHELRAGIEAYASALRGMIHMRPSSNMEERFRTPAL